MDVDTLILASGGADVLCTSIGRSIAREFLITGSSSLFRLPPRHVTSQASAEVQRGLVNWLLGCCNPEVKVVSGRSAFETLERVLGQIDREIAARRARRFVQRTLAPYLVPSAGDGDEADQVQHFLD